jgi:hypothetical protein
MYHERREVQRNRCIVRRRLTKGLLFQKIEVDLHMIDFVTGEGVKRGTFTPKNVSLSSLAKVFGILKTSPLNVEFNGHLSLDTNKVFQVELLTNSIVSRIFSRVPKLDEFAFAPERTLLRMNENNVGIVVPVEQFAFVTRLIELFFVIFELLLRHSHGGPPYLSKLALCCLNSAASLVAKVTSRDSPLARFSTNDR